MIIQVNWFLFEHTMKNPLPEHTSDQQLAEDFKTYFTNKTLHSIII